MTSTRTKQGLNLHIFTPSIWSAESSFNPFLGSIAWTEKKGWKFCLKILKIFLCKTRQMFNDKQSHTNNPQVQSFISRTSKIILSADVVRWGTIMLNTWSTTWRRRFEASVNKLSKISVTTSIQCGSFSEEKTLYRSVSDPSSIKDWYARVYLELCRKSVLSLCHSNGTTPEVFSKTKFVFNWKEISVMMSAWTITSSISWAWWASLNSWTPT